MKNSYSRRAFLRTLGLIGLGASIPAPALAAMKMADVTRLTGNRVKVSETRFLMGTFVAITAIHESRTLAEHGVGLALRRSNDCPPSLTGTATTPLFPVSTTRDGWVTLRRNCTT